MTSFSRIAEQGAAANGGRITWSGRLAVRYAEFQKVIARMAVSASETACRSFGLDTIDRLHASTQGAIREEFTEAERLRLDEILAGLDQQPASSLKQKLRELNDIHCRDPIRAIEFNPKSTELLCAVDSWLDYRITRDPACIVQRSHGGDWVRLDVWRFRAAGCAWGTSTFGNVRPIGEECGYERSR